MEYTIKCYFYVKLFANESDPLPYNSSSSAVTSMLLLTTALMWLVAILPQPMSAYFMVVVSFNKQLLFLLLSDMTVILSYAPIYAHRCNEDLEYKHIAAIQANLIVVAASTPIQKPRSP